jgi:hypothetical protein
MHRIAGRPTPIGSDPNANDDRRARPLLEPQRPMLDRLLAADPTFDPSPWHATSATGRW